ncbi:MAG TPA: helix-turn-helix transcriptional regulator [Thermoanaerobaculia bacterium]|jgi:tetratricopeptide (TPR) repeat protein/DNA-binding XRE family transcriptional regulator
MRREHLLARLLRAVSGKTQEQFGEETGVHPSLIALIELGKATPGRDLLERMARCASISLPDADEVLGSYETLRRTPQRQGGGVEDLFREITERFDTWARAAYGRLLRLPLPDQSPREEDRRRAEEQWRLLADLPSESRLAVVRVAAEYQNWALCERVCAESTQRASSNVEEATALARLAEEIAERVRGPEAWRLRVQGYASAHGANALRVAGELRAAEAGLEKARRLWHAGSDPEGLLDPGRLLDLEASLRRDQRRFAEALALLDEAAAVGRSPGRVLIKKGFTLEVMGEYEHAIETLLQAAHVVERQGDARLLYMQRFNLAVLCCHVGRFSEATELLDQVRDLVTKRGDAIELNRVTWLEGRIAAGLGRPHEALRLLKQARERFAAERMSYDVALALLEEAVLLLDQGRAAEVKVLARELTRVFKSKGVHREALAALRLFKDAADQETATARLARRVLAYLFRTRHDPGLRFES